MYQVYYRKLFSGGQNAPLWIYIIKIFQGSMPPDILGPKASQLWPPTFSDGHSDHIDGDAESSDTDVISSETGMSFACLFTYTYNEFL